MNGYIRHKLWGANYYPRELKPDHTLNPYDTMKRYIENGWHILETQHTHKYYKKQVKNWLTTQQCLIKPLNMWELIWKLNQWKKLDETLLLYKAYKA